MSAAFLPGWDASLRVALLACAGLGASGAGWRAWVVAGGKANASVGRALAAAGTLLCLSAVSFGTFAPIPVWVRALSLVHASATLCKLLALSRPGAGPVPLGRGLAFLALYPALEPSKGFVRDPCARRGAGARALALGVLELFAAFAIAAFAASRGWLDAGAYPAAWSRAGAFVLLLDGGFRAAAGLLRAVGWFAEDVFREPWMASDLADFWSRRWNRFIARTLTIEVYAPVKRRAGRVAAVLAAFLVSGVFHEAILGLSTGGGKDGRYTAFFLAQGVGILASSFVGGRLGALAPRAFAWVLVLATAPLFLGGPFPEAAPMESLLRGWF